MNSQRSRLIKVLRGFKLSNVKFWLKTSQIFLSEILSKNSLIQKIISLKMHSIFSIHTPTKLYSVIFCKFHAFFFNCDCVWSWGRNNSHYDRITKGKRVAKKSNNKKERKKNQKDHPVFRLTLSSVRKFVLKQFVIFKRIFNNKDLKMRVKVN